MAEMVGGILLTTRRTALLGSLISGGVMVNVLFLNLCYDVPVKLYSAHLLAMSLCLAAADASRLLNFFFLGRAVSPPVRERLFKRPALDRVGVAMRTLAVLWFVGEGLYSANQQRAQMTPSITNPLHGVWDVEEFELDGMPVPPLLTESRRWKRVVIDDRGMMAIFSFQPVSGPTTRKLVAIGDKSIRTLPTDPSGMAEYSFEQSEPDRLVLGGRLKSGDKE